DGERSAVLDVARGAEETLGRVECRRVDATGEHATRGGSGDVVCTAEARDRVKQHHDVASALHKTLRALDGEFCDGGVILGRPVEGGGDDLTLHRALHVGDFFGT